MKHGPKRTALYIGLDGPILVPSRKGDPRLGAALAPYAKPFVRWALEHFQVRWLGRRPVKDIIYVAKQLGLRDDAVPICGFRQQRSEAIHERENFFWVDGSLTAEESAWLSSRGPSRFLAVNPLTGVTPEHKRALEYLILKGART